MKLHKWAPITLALMPAAAGGARAECTVETFTEISVTIFASRPLGPLHIDGTDATMLLDTGGFHGVLFPADWVCAHWNGVGLDRVCGRSGQWQTN